MPLTITSRQHPILQACRRLAIGRGDAGTILLDGEHLIADALASGVTLRALVVERGRHAEVTRNAARAGVAIYEGAPVLVAAASPVRQPTGIIAIAEWHPAPIAAVFLPAPAFAIVLVDVQDPGNVGAVIRSADAFGASGVIAADRTADPAGWKALRGAMGSTFHLPVARASFGEAIEVARRTGVHVVAAVAGSATPLTEAPFENPTLLLVGNEGAGLPEHYLAHADRRVTIPMRAGVESLNVAVTAALMLHEARRQRAARHLLRRES